jgi:hypothetical protein
MTHHILLSVAAGTLLVGTAAAAQSPALDKLARRTAEPVELQHHQDGFVRVQSAISFFVSGPSGDSSDAEKLREKARQSIYTTAARECDLLKATLASECRLESVNSNINSTRQYGPTQQEGFTVNGSMTFRITLK